MIVKTVLAAAAAAILTTNGALAQSARDCDGQGRCRVAISVTGACEDQRNIQVSPETVAMGPGGQRTIVWRLPPGFEFCPASGDGIVFKRGDNDFQFFDARRTDHPDGDDDAGPPDKCRKHFRWKNKNEPHTAGRTYEYLIRFTGPNRQSCVKDPFIRNG